MVLWWSAFRLASFTGRIARTYPVCEKDKNRASASLRKIFQNLNTKTINAKFLCRNRIISCLSLGVVVVEAPRRSGSPITARLAGAYSRQVMAVTGSPLDPRCHGSNHPIRTSAALIETVDDIIEVVRLLIENMVLKAPDQKTP